MKYFHIQKRYLYIGIIISLVGLIILSVVKLELALGIFGAGFAAFTGAYAAFMFEKSEKEDINQKRELKYLNFTLGYLRYVKAQHEEYRIKIMVQNSSNYEAKKVAIFNSNNISMENISFLCSSNQQLFEDIYSCSNQILSLENDIADYNSKVIADQECKYTITEGTYKISPLHDRFQILNKIQNKIAANLDFFDKTITAVQRVIDSDFTA